MQDDETFALSNQAILPIITGSIEDIRGTIKKYNAKVLCNCSEKINADIDPQLLRESLINLLENAIKYGDNNSSVTLTVKEKSNNILIDIENTGSIIPGKEHDRIFNRFYRVDKSRSKKTGGTGLGLAIVKNLANSLNGDVGVRNAPQKGSEFWFSLPVSK